MNLDNENRRMMLNFSVVLWNNNVVFVIVYDQYIDLDFVGSSGVLVDTQNKLETHIDRCAWDSITVQKIQQPGHVFPT